MSEQITETVLTLPELKKILNIWAHSIQPLVDKILTWEWGNNILENKEDIKILVENRFISILFRRIIKKINKKVFYDKGIFFREIKELLEKYINWFANKWMKMGVFQVLWDKEWVIDYIWDDNWRKKHMSMIDFLTKIDIDEGKRCSLNSWKDFCYKTITENSGVICLKTISIIWKLVFYFDWYNNVESNVINKLMEDLVFVIKYKLEEIENKFYDFLTWCKNKTYLNNFLNEKNLALIYLDLNKFKYINDTFGHTFWDEVLIKFATTLFNCIRRNEWDIIRLSWDEFCILIRWNNNKELLDIIERRIEEKKLNKEFVIITPDWVHHEIWFSFWSYIDTKNKLKLSDLLILADENMRANKPADWISYRIATWIEWKTIEDAKEILNQVMLILGIENLKT